MLDMIPFMTGKGDSPPLYMLYAVVVHLDTLNASFSGHYVSYVKDLQGNWFRIDDTEVSLLPCLLSACSGYLTLFYCPTFFFLDYFFFPIFFSYMFGKGQS